MAAEWFATAGSNAVKAFKAGEDLVVDRELKRQEVAQSWEKINLARRQTAVQEGSLQLEQDRFQALQDEQNRKLRAMATMQATTEMSNIMSNGSLSGSEKQKRLTTITAGLTSTFRQFGGADFMQGIRLENFTDMSDTRQQEALQAARTAWGYEDEVTDDEILGRTVLATDTYGNKVLLDVFQIASQLPMVDKAYVTQLQNQQEEHNANMTAKRLEAQNKVLQNQQLNQENTIRQRNMDDPTLGSSNTLANGDISIFTGHNAMGQLTNDYRNAPDGSGAAQMQLSPELQTMAASPEALAGFIAQYGLTADKTNIKPDVVNQLLDMYSEINTKSARFAHMSKDDAANALAREFATTFNILISKHPALRLPLFNSLSQRLQAPTEEQRKNMAAADMNYNKLTWAAKYNSPGQIGGLDSPLRNSTLFLKDIVSANKGSYEAFNALLNTSNNLTQGVISARAYGSAKESEAAKIPDYNDVDKNIRYYQALRDEIDLLRSANLGPADKIRALAMADALENSPVFLAQQAQYDAHQAGGNLLTDTRSSNEYMQNLNKVYSILNMQGSRDEIVKTLKANGFEVLNDNTIRRKMKISGEGLFNWGTREVVLQYGVLR